MIWLCTALLASAADPSAVQAAMAETEAVREDRLATRPPTIPADAYAKAAAGKVVTGLQSVPGQSARMAWGITVVDVPVDELWAAVRAFSDKTDLGAVSFSQVQTGSSCHDDRLIFQYLPISIPLVSDRWWVSHIRHNHALAAASHGKVQELAFRATADETRLRTDEARALAAKATPISFSQGGWLLVDVGGGETYLEYHALSDPGGSLSAGLASSFATGAVSDNLEAIREIHRQGGGCPR